MKFLEKVGNFGKFPTEYLNENLDLFNGKNFSKRNSVLLQTEMEKQAVRIRHFLMPPR